MNILYSSRFLHMWQGALGKKKKKTFVAFSEKYVEIEIKLKLK